MNKPETSQMIKNTLFRASTEPQRAETAEFGAFQHLEQLQVS